jgi:flagellar basal body rod protein FlgC
VEIIDKMRLSSTYSIAASGVQAASIQLRASAHNTANSQTPNFAPTRAMTRSAQEGVYVHLQKNTEGGTLALPDDVESPLAQSGTDAVQETVNNRLAAAAYKANLKVLQSAMDLTGVVIELKK